MTTQQEKKRKAKARIKAREKFKKDLDPDFISPYLTPKVDDLLRTELVLSNEAGGELTVEDVKKIYHDFKNLMSTKKIVHMLNSIISLEVDSENPTLSTMHIYTCSKKKSNLCNKKHHGIYITVTRVSDVEIANRIMNTLGLRGTKSFDDCKMPPWRKSEK